MDTSEQQNPSPDEQWPWLQPGPESSLPVLAAMVATIALQLAIPERYTLVPRWPLIVPELLLIVVLITLQPDPADSTHRIRQIYQPGAAGGDHPGQHRFGHVGHPDFMFPQLANPELAPQNWVPRFVDYLYLSVTNVMAFSPTDVMPLARWAKLMMMLQATVAVSAVALVFARAVNVLS